MRISDWSSDVCSSDLAFVDVAIRNALEQQRHHPPAVGHGFELGRRAQVLKEGSHVLRPVERSQGLGQGLPGGLGITFVPRFGTLLHWCPMFYRVITILQEPSAVIR